MTLTIKNKSTGNTTILFLEHCEKMVAVDRDSKLNFIFKGHSTELELPDKNYKSLKKKLLSQIINLSHSNEIISIEY